MKKTTHQRTDLLAVLTSVLPGITSNDENLQQSSCFIFDKGRVSTFNEEIFATAPCEIGFSGAVPAMTMMNLLSKMTEDTVEIYTTSNDQVIIAGRHKKSGIKYESKILLPIDEIKVPAKFKKFGAGFLKAVDLAHSCCSTSDLHFGIRCVHITKSIVEAMDNIQACRVSIDTGFENDAMIRREAISKLVTSDVTKFAEDDKWVHFRSPSRRIISVRRYVEEYPNLDEVFKFKGSSFTLPKGLAEAADKASIFTGEDQSVTSSELVSIKLTKNKLSITGEGDTGWYREHAKVKYSGPDLSFAISPDTLMKIAKEHTDAAVSNRSLRVQGEAWVLMFMLFKSPSKSSSKDE